MMESSPMNGGFGQNSYAKNSTLQRRTMKAAMKVVEEIFKENLNIKNIVCRDSNTFRIADLGCSVGPNTFYAMETMVNLVEEIFHSHDKSLHTENLEFQVFFNDLTTNDFNTLFMSLPHERNYLAAGVPGSFYGRLFPSSSIHVAFSSISLHWLSKTPIELQIKGSPTWNKRRIHYTGAPDVVVKAYMDQYAKDMGVFFNARAQEIVRGGMLVIVMAGVHDGTLNHKLGLALTFLGFILMDMVKEGILNEDQVDSFNFPNVYPSVKQMTRLVEENGCFSIVKMESNDDTTGGNVDVDLAIMHMRASVEGTFLNHFGKPLVDEIFKREKQRRMDLSHMLNSSEPKFPVQLFGVLKRN